MEGEHGKGGTTWQWQGKESKSMARDNDMVRMSVKGLQGRKYTGLILGGGEEIAFVAYEIPSHKSVGT